MTLRCADPAHVRRPCCGALLPVEALWPGAAHFPHEATCRYARKARPWPRSGVQIYGLAPMQHTR